MVQQWKIRKEVIQNTSEAKYQKNSKQLVDPVFRTNQLSTNNNNNNSSDSSWDMVILSWSVFCVSWSLWPYVVARCMSLVDSRGEPQWYNYNKKHTRSQLMMLCPRWRQTPEKKKHLLFAGIFCSVFFLLSVMSLVVSSRTQHHLVGKKNPQEDEELSGTREVGLG